MENEVIEFDMGLGGGGDDAVAIIDDEEMTDDSPSAANGIMGSSSFFDPSTYVLQRDLDLEPCEGMEFESEEAAKGFYNSYARRVGFSTRVSSSRRSRKDGAIIQRSFVCAKEGFRNLNEKRTKDREIKRPRTVTRVGCKASMSVKIQDSGKWVVSTFVKEHNHELVPPDQIFMRFQEELVGTLTLMASKVEDDGEVTTYQVAKFGEDNKSYRVNFNVLEMRATCSCCMFEFSGLLCRHVLAVFRVTNVLTLPSCYILKRWTINAKSSVILEERVNDAFSSYLESHTVRYNTLRHEALKFVEEGAESVDTYNVAMSALEEAARRVAITAKNEGRVLMINGRTREDARSNGTLTKRNISNHHESLDQNLSEDEMDRKIQELNKEVECAKRKCEVYRSNLVSVLKDIEDHKQQLSLKVQIIRYSMKDCL
ncbi:FAR1 DNA binding domain-containing protein [Cynara cardunculus var. scolymus]|uniref:Protein FAR1-RELATED SEQUENCE n=1 Tax=Cynara cardunculus var. scolymus TaxID=59895 RepID=A0A103XD62_CYNCS|nr:FAR1 DNA binding domain-containing protein [Cynara cardunculus var. scolymus]